MDNDFWNFGDGRDRGDPEPDYSGVVAFVLAFVAAMILGAAGFL